MPDDVPKSTRKTTRLVNDRLTFPKSLRLRRKCDFDRVFAARCSAADDFLVVFVAPGQSPDARLGLVVSRRVGSAVVRNRIKRLIREAFRLTRYNLPTGIDIVCVARPNPSPKRTQYEAGLAALTAHALARSRRSTEQQPSGQ